jgi:hypothetical protein
VALLACASRPPAVLAPSSEERIGQLLDAVRLDALLEQTRRRAVLQFGNPSMPMDDAARAVAQEVLGDCFSPERVRPHIASRLRRGFDPAYADASLEFLGSARSVVSASGFFQLPSRVPAGRIASLSEGGFSATDERDVLVDQILALGRLREASLERSLALTVSMWEGGNERLPRSQRMSRDHLWALSMAQRHESALLLEGEVIPALRRLPLHELEAFAAFLSSDAGRWFVTNMDAALVEGLSVAGREAGERLVDGFQALERR